MASSAAAAKHSRTGMDPPWFLHSLHHLAHPLPQRDGASQPLFHAFVHRLNQEKISTNLVENNG